MGDRPGSPQGAVSFYAAAAGLVVVVVVDVLCSFAHSVQGGIISVELM